MNNRDFSYSNAEDRQRLVDALSYLDPTSYDTWITVGMALYNSGVPQAQWDAWSATADEFEQRENDRQWRSFSNGKPVNPRTVGTVFSLAQKNGWHPSRNGTTPPALPTPPPAKPVVLEQPPEPDPWIDADPVDQHEYDKAPFYWKSGNQANLILHGDWAYPTNLDRPPRIRAIRLHKKRKDGRIKKWTPTFVFQQHTETALRAWVCREVPAPRPLYRLTSFQDPGGKSDGLPVIVCEGEKAAEACYNLVWDRGYHVTTSIGGSQAPHKSDWTSLAGREVLIWPDADEDGDKYAMHVAKLLHGIAERTQILDIGMLVENPPKGWDAADCTLDPRNIVAWLALDHFEPKPPFKLPDDPVDPVEPNAEKPPDGLAEKLQRTAKGKIAATLSNLVLLLNEYGPLQGLFRFNLFTEEVEICAPPPGEETRPPLLPTDAIEDYHATIVRSWLGNHLDVNFSRNDTLDAIAMVARDQCYHPLREALDELAWDGTKRVHTLFTRYLRAEGAPPPDHWPKDSFGEYLEQLAVKWMVGAVARIFQPGVKVDNVLILEGSQGTRKSAAFMTLFGNQWYFTTEVTVGSKDFLMALRGKWAIELGELASIERASHDRVKNFLSTQYDRYRAPYARHPVTVARQCIFVGTTNRRGEYLPDDTGNRRYWPVAIEQINLEAIEHDREQLWAEAVFLYRTKTPWWFEEDTEEVLKQQEERRAELAWEENVRLYLDTPPEDASGNWWCAIEPPHHWQITTLDLVLSHLGVSTDKYTEKTKHQLSAILRMLHWKPMQQRVILPMQPKDEPKMKRRIWVRSRKDPNAGTLDLEIAPWME